MLISRAYDAAYTIAISLCEENNMPLFVFNMNEKGNIYKACKGQITGTIVK